MWRPTCGGREEGGGGIRAKAYLADVSQQNSLVLGFLLQAAMSFGRQPLKPLPFRVQGTVVAASAPPSLKPKLLERVQELASFYSRCFFAAETCAEAEVSSERALPSAFAPSQTSQNCRSVGCVAMTSGRPPRINGQAQTLTGITLVPR